MGTDTSSVSLFNDKLSVLLVSGYYNMYNLIILLVQIGPSPEF